MTDVKPPKRVAIYARYSTEMQSTRSIEDQIRDCSEEAERKGWIVVDRYADHAMSGARSDRPEFQRLQHDLGSGRFDVVLVEHLDRLSRDQEDTARFYKLAMFHDIELHQLGRGEVSTLEIGLNSAMAASFIEVVRHKILRGMRGRVATGKNAGGLAYGYRPKPLVDAEGKPDGSDLEIVAGEAAVIRRIFEEYAKGVSPRQIAAELNTDGVPAPRGRGEGSGHWKANTIYGHRARGTGILNNELYIGRRVWNRLTYRKNPMTNKRVSRLNPREDWKISEVPHLRIIDQELWDAVKARQDSVDHARTLAEAEGKRGAGAAQATRRRKYLLSGLMTCGQCGGNLTVAGKGDRRRYYCANAKEKGPSVCEGMPGLREIDAASSILSRIRDGLMQDDAYQLFKTRLEQKLHAEQAQRGQELQDHDARIRETRKKRDNILEAVEAAKFSASLLERLDSLEEQLQQLQEQHAQFEISPIDLPDDLPALYRRYVDDLTATLMDEEVSGAASDELHRLLETVVVSWDAERGVHELELRGKLLEMLAKGKPAGGAGLATNLRSLKLVAGAGFEPATFRL